jgi:hypothetical protein
MISGGDGKGDGSGIDVGVGHEVGVDEGIGDGIGVAVEYTGVGGTERSILTREQARIDKMTRISA